MVFICNTSVYPKVKDTNADIVPMGCNRVPGYEGREQQKRGYWQQPFKNSLQQGGSMRATLTLNEVKQCLIFLSLEQFSFSLDCFYISIWITEIIKRPENSLKSKNRFQNFVIIHFVFYQVISFKIPHVSWHGNAPTHQTPSVCSG